MASTPRTSLSGELPSYARPTAASENRTAAAEEVEGKRKATPPPSHFKPFCHYSLAAVSSRTKAKWLGPFRLLDLPPELRNRVYEYTGIDSGFQHIDLRHPGRGNPLRCVPNLLQANQQLLNEAGSYYFSGGVFDILVDRDQVQPLIDFLQLIGKSNLEALVNNQHVTISLIHKNAKPRAKMFHRASALATNHGFNFEDAVHATALSLDYDRVAKAQYPNLQSWKFKSSFPANPGLMPLYMQTSMGMAEIDLSVSFVRGLQVVVKGIFALLEGREVDLGERSIENL